MKIRKSDRTKERIAIAARQIFADLGYERATIRSIAEKAAINVSMIIRYFGSKENLFATVAVFDLRLPGLEEAPKEARGLHLVRHFLTRWESGDTELQALLKVAVTHEAAREAMTQIFNDQLAAYLTLQGLDRASERACLIASQMLGLALARYVLAFPACVNLDDTEIVKRVGRTIQAYLDEWD